jgi:hypothetical protein
MLVNIKIQWDQTTLSCKINIQEPFSQHFLMEKS